MQIQSYIDHTLLNPTARVDQIEQLCHEAETNAFYAVCVHGCFASLCHDLLQHTSVRLACVVGFPLGANHSLVKEKESMQAVQDGAHEIDMVINLSWVKSKRWSAIYNEINAIKKLIGTCTLKVILEMCYLTQEEKEKAIIAAIDGGADFLKTSTGFGTGGATIEDILLLKKIAKNQVALKASGGISSRATAMKYIALGVSRIGTSHGLAIVKN